MTATPTVNPIKLKIGTNTKRETVIVDDNITPKKALEQQCIEYGVATVSLDGCPLDVKQMNMTLAELGVKDSAMLIAVIKTENAA